MGSGSEINTPERNKTKKGTRQMAEGMETEQATELEVLRAELAEAQQEALTETKTMTETQAERQERKRRRPVIGIERWPRAVRVPTYECRQRLADMAHEAGISYRVGTGSRGGLYFWMGSQPKADRPLCGARTRQGTACRAKAVDGRARCRMHGGGSTGAKTAEGRARICESNRRRAEARRQANVTKSDKIWQSFSRGRQAGKSENFGKYRNVLTRDCASFCRKSRQPELITPCVHRTPMSSAEWITSWMRNHLMDGDRQLITPWWRNDPMMAKWPHDGEMTPCQGIVIAMQGGNSHARRK